MLSPFEKGGGLKQPTGDTTAGTTPTWSPAFDSAWLPTQVKDFSSCTLKQEDLEVSTQLTPRRVPQASTQPVRGKLHRFFVPRPCNPLAPTSLDHAAPAP